MTETPSLANVALTDNGNGTYTVTRQASADANANTKLYNATLATAPGNDEVTLLVRWVSEGRWFGNPGGPEAGAHKVTKAEGWTCTFTPSLLRAERAWEQGGTQP